MTKNELHNLVSNSKGNESNICQIYAFKNGEVIFDESFKDYDSDTPININSVTKGVMALLAGIAIDKGYIKSVNQKVMDFFPDYIPKRGEKTIYEVTIKHLLTMTAPYKGRSEPWKKVCTSEDWTRAVLDNLGGRSGITGEFRYATLGIQILSGIIENAIHGKLIDFANEYLFLPLGIPKHELHGDSSKEDQFAFFMNKTPRRHEWYSDPKDVVTAGWGLCLSGKDEAKLGELVLNNGVYQGKQIISKEWIKEMLTPRQKLGMMFGYMEYGYLWYKPYKDKEVYAAIGDSGNIIYINKEKNVSVGITGTFKPRIFDRVQFIEKYII
ncbi:MAG: serine hydrolase [Bacilli bacterium]|nr:serine hydrolase [Bacilli bacterium]